MTSILLTNLLLEVPKCAANTPAPSNLPMKKWGKLAKNLTSLRQVFHEDTAYQSHCPILLMCDKQDKVSMVIKAMKSWCKKDKQAY